MEKQTASAISTGGCGIKRSLNGQHSTEENKFSFSYHLYAGSNRSQGQPEEENALLPGQVNWDFLNGKPQGVRWVYTESGYYVTDFSEEQLALAQQFYQAESYALSPGNLFGIHTLTKESGQYNPLTLYNHDGITWLERILTSGQ